MKKPSHVRSVHIGTRITKGQASAIKKRLGKYRSMSDYLLRLIAGDLAAPAREQSESKLSRPMEYMTNYGDTE